MRRSEGDWEKAIQTLEQANLLDKTNRAKQKIAQLYLQYGEMTEGLSRLLEIAGGSNATADDVEKIAQAIVQNQDWEELLNFLAPNLARFPNHYRLGFLAAIANEELGNSEAAQNQFLKLLQADQEISTGGVTYKNPMQSRLDRYQRAMPQNALELVKVLTETRQYAYGYQNKNNSGGYLGSPTPPTYLPSDLDSCRQFSLCHLCEISRELSEEEVDGLQQQLERIGVENTNILMGGLSERDLDLDPLALLEIDPDNKAALAIALVWTDRTQVEVAQEVFLKAYVAFKESFPTLGLIAATKLDQSKPENQSRLAAAVKRLKTLEEPDLILVSFIGRQVSQAGADERDPLRKYRAELNQLLLDWYPKLTANQQLSTWTFRVMTNSFRGEKSPKRLIEFLDEELARVKGQGNAQSSHSGIFGRYGGYQKVILLPYYPPTELTSFPNYIYSQLKMPKPGGYTGSYGGYLARDEEVDSLPASQVAIAVSTAKDPTMKALLEIKYFYQRDLDMEVEENGVVKTTASLPDSIKAAFGDQVIDAKSAIDQLLDVSKANVDAWYLAGALAVHEERWDDAAANFETMRSLPMTAGTRSKIDGHLVALATVGLPGDLKNNQNEKVVMSAKSAALRLQRGKLSQQQRAALIAAFETLELKDEAEKLENRIANAANAGSGFPRVSGGGLTRSTVPLDRITKLNEEGKTAVAARLLSQEFLGLARPQLDLSAKKDDSYELREFKRKVESLSLEKELFKQLDPGTAITARRLGVWAFTNEAFGKPEVAQGIYEKLLEAYPRDDGARLRYVVLKTLAGDEQAFARNFPKVRKRSRDQFLASLLKRLADRKAAAKNLLSLIESVMVYKEGEDGESIDEASMNLILSILGSQFSIVENDSESILPSPFSAQTEEKNTLEKNEQTEEATELMKRQRNLLDRVATRMTNSALPGQAATGFTALSASAESAGEPIDSRMVALALKTVYPPKKIRSTSSNLVYAPSYVWSLGAKRVTKRTPVEFLGRYYGFSGVAHDQQVEAIAEKLESLKIKEDATKLRQTYALYRASDDEYAGVAGGLIDAAKGTGRYSDEQRWRTALRTIVEVWKERKIQADVSQFFIDYAVAMKRYSGGRVNGFPYQEREGLLTEYAKELAEVKGLAKVSDFMKRLRFKMLGSETEQQELLKLLVDQETVQRTVRAKPGKLAPVGTYYFLADSLKSHGPKELYWLGVNEMERFPIPNRRVFSDYELRSKMAEFKEDEVDSQLDWLRQSGALAGLSNFNPHFSTEGNSSQSVWGSFLAQLRYGYPGGSKDKAIDRLSKKKDPTFGEKILLSFVKPEPANVYEMLGSEMAAFKTLPAEQQIRIARFASEVGDLNVKLFRQKKTNTLLLSDNGKAAKKLSTRLLNKSVESVTAKLMQAKRFKDLGIEDRKFKEWSENLLASMSLEEPEKLLAAVSQISKFSSKLIRSGQRFDRVPTKVGLIEGVAAREISFESMKLIRDTLEKEHFQEVKFSEKLSESMGKFLQSQYEANQTAFKKQEDKEPLVVGASKEKVQAVLNYPAVASMKQLINQLGEEFGDGELTAFIPELQFVCLQLKNGQGKAVNQWLHSDESVKYPKIRHAFRLASDCSQAMLEQIKARSDSKRALQTKPYLQEILKFIADGSKPLQSRSRVAVHLVEYDALPAQEVTACCRVIAEACDAGQVFESSLAFSIFAALQTSSAAPDIKDASFTFAKSWAQSLGKRKAWSVRENNLIACMKILDLNGDQAEVRRLLKIRSIEDSSVVAVALIELGYFKEAKKTCETIWSKDFLDGYNSAKFTKILESKLPEFIEQFNDEGGKYLAEVYFSEFRNIKGDATIKTTPESRLKVLAERFSSDKFKSRRNRQIALILLSKLVTKSEAIDSALTKEVEGLSLEQLFGTKTSNLKARIFAAFLSTQILRENFEPVQAMWEQVNKLIESKKPHDISWSAKANLDRLSNSADESFRKLLIQLTPEQIVTILPTLRSLNQPSYQRQLNPEVVQPAHFMAGGASEFAKYLKEQDEYLKANGETPKPRTSDMNSFLSNLKQEYQKLEKANGKARVNFLTSAWRFGSEQGFSFGSKEFEAGTIDPSKKNRTKYGLELLKHLRLAKNRKLLKLGPELAKIESVNGAIWLQLARRQVGDKQDANAAESFKKSIEDAKEDMDQAKFNRRVEYASTLVKLKRNKEAKEVIKDIPADQLFKANKDLLKKLETTLNED